MRKVFLDCGANNGSSVRKFRRIREDSDDFEVFSFEPNEVFEKEIILTGAKYINKAVWIEDGIIPFYVVSVDKYGNDSRRTGASSANKAKSDWNLKFHKEVEACDVSSIDMSNWILSNFEERDYIILKMDIEGSEYDVLEKMIGDGSMSFIDELWIEFHWSKCGVSKQRHDELVRKINTFKIKLDPHWDGWR